MPPRHLYIAKSTAEPTLSLPVDAVTRTFAVLGQRGTGKTNAAVVLVEEMAKAGGHVVVLDPVGAWYGITRDGEGKGCKGVVIGGEHGDVPLEETGGQLLAELVVARHWPVVVVDMKLMRKGAQLRFMADFLEGLFHSNREPLHVVFEEADRPLPQSGRNFDPTAGRVLGAGEDIVKLGRSRGLGATLVTQRPATLNKNVLEVCETLLLFRLMGPNDRKAAKAWVDANADEAKLKTVMESLAKLKLGECWLWSPAWLEVLRRIKIRERKSFDSSATPEVGVRGEQPTARPTVDLEALKVAMAETVERAKANDPAELRKRIAELESELNAAMNSMPQPQEILVPDRVAIAKLSETVAEMTVHVDEFEATAARYGQQLEDRMQVVRDVKAEAVQMLADMSDVLDRVGGMGRTQVERLPGQPEGGHMRAAGRDTSSPAASRPANGSDPLGRAARTLLDTLLSVYPRRLSKAELSTLSGYRPRSSTYRNALSALRTRELLDEDGRSFAPSASAVEEWGVPAAKDAADIRAMWKRALGGGAPGQMFEYLTRIYPASASKAMIEEATGYSITSSTFRNGLSALRTNGLILDLGDGEVQAVPALFS